MVNETGSITTPSGNTLSKCGYNSHSSCFILYRAHSVEKGLIGLRPIRPEEDKCTISLHYELLTNLDDNFIVTVMLPFEAAQTKA